MGYVNTFNKDAYKAFDNPAKNYVKSVMGGRGWTITEPDNPYIQDLIAEKDGDRFYVECEVKSRWRGEFPFNDIQLPGRKAKFCNERTLFFIINGDLNDAFCFWNTTVLESPLVEVSNTRHKSGEKFFKIPVSKAFKVSDVLGGKYETSN